MKMLLLAVTALTIFIASEAVAYEYVEGYTRKNGTYVRGHFKDTSGDGQSYNNWNQ